MKRYTIACRRNKTEPWTEWSRTDDIKTVHDAVITIERNGWESKVSDAGVNQLVPTTLNKLVEHINNLIKHINELRMTNTERNGTLYVVWNTRIDTLQSLKEIVEAMRKGGE